MGGCQGSPEHTKQGELYRQNDRQFLSCKVSLGKENHHFSLEKCVFRTKEILGFQINVVCLFDGLNVNNNPLLGSSFLSYDISLLSHRKGDI